MELICVFWHTCKDLVVVTLGRLMSAAIWLIILLAVLGIFAALGCGMIAALASLGTPVLLAILILVCL